VSAELGFGGYPSVAESVMVGRDLMLAAYENQPIHVLHLSARESVDELRSARSAGVQAQRQMASMLMWIARLYLWRWMPGGKRAGFYSINLMRALHPAWFREDLEQLFGLLARGAIRPRVAERITFDEVSEAHRRLEAGGLEGKLVLCP